MLPWFAQQSQYLVQRAREGRLPHAILLCGPPGVGKLVFAQHLAQTLVCESGIAQGCACQTCRSCQQFKAGSHPDYFHLHPQDDSKQIKIDQIRELIGSIGLTRHYRAYRVALIEPAEAMNTATANSLLKTLEEPPSGTVLLLVSSQPSRLPATIRSRCQAVSIALPDYAQAIEWLAAHSDDRQAIQQALVMSHGAPLIARRYLEDDSRQRYLKARQDFYQIATADFSPTAVAASWLKLDPPVPIQWLYTWVAELILDKNAIGYPTANNSDPQRLHNLAERIDLSGLFGLLQRLCDAIRYESGALNRQLVYESLLVDWRVLAKRPHQLPRNR